MNQMLKFTSEMLKRYLKPVKDKQIKVDEETLSVLFKLITLKVEQDFIKQICSLLYNICVIDHEQIYNNIKSDLIKTIHEVKQNMFDRIKVIKPQVQEESKTVKDFKKILTAHGKEEDEEMIVTTKDNMEVDNSSDFNR